MDTILKKLSSKKYNQSNNQKTKENNPITPDFRAPLLKGWKREIVFENFSSEAKIDSGAVIYYSPGSQRKLQSIEAIRKVLDKHSFGLTVDNFSFSTELMVGIFKQVSNGSLYKEMTDVAMIEHLRTIKQLRNVCREIKINKSTEKADNRNMTGPDGLSSFETASLSVSETDQKSDESGNESDAMELRKKRIILRTYGSEERNFYDDDGYLYSINNNAASTKNYYFRCKNDTRYNCNVRAISKNKDLQHTILKGKHSHSGQLSDVDKMKFRCQLHKEIQRRPLDFGREVYLNTMNDMVDEIDISNAPDKTELASFIYRRKMKFVPKLPKNVTDFEKMMSNKNYNETFSKDKRKQPFYRGTWKTEKGGSNIAFISEAILQIVLLMSSIAMRMDGTFKVLPRHMKFRQLFIISVIYREKSYPLAYILMEKRNFEAYDDVFTNLNGFIPSQRVSEIITDYEAATRKAAVKHYPEARLVGCWFHYVQAINRVAKRFGMWKDDKFSDAIKYISALALLPHNYVLNGFDHIDTTIASSYRWGRFKKYWLNQWSRANISVYGTVDRTNNQAESLNKSLNVLIGARHPNIWKLIDRIILLEMDYSNKIKKAKRGKIFKDYKKAETTLLNKQIISATGIFERTKDIGTFLDNVTFDIRLDVLLKERLNIDEMNDDEKDDYAEIIPNTFNPQTSRKRKL